MDIELILYIMIMIIMVVGTIGVIIYCVISSSKKKKKAHQDMLNMLQKRVDDLQKYLNKDERFIKIQTTGVAVIMYKESAVEIGLNCVTYGGSCYCVYDDCDVCMGVIDNKVYIYPSRANGYASDNYASANIPYIINISEIMYYVSNAEGILGNINMTKLIYTKDGKGGTLCFLNGALPQLRKILPFKDLNYLQTSNMSGGGIGANRNNGNFPFEAQMQSQSYVVNPTPYSPPPTPQNTEMPMLEDNIYKTNDDM